MDAITEYLAASDWQQLLIDWGLNLITALAIFIIGRWLARMVCRALKRVLVLRELDETLITFLNRFVYALLLTAVIIAALDSLGLQVTSLLAVMGAAGLAIGLALKDSLGNFAAGVMLVMFRPFTKGDFVEVAGISGKVNEVRIFSTILTTGDNRMVIIPNGQVAGDTITNYTALDTRRVDLVIGVGYDDDLKLVRKILNEICDGHPLILNDPATNIFIVNLGDSSVDFVVRPWCKTDDYWTVHSDVLENAKAGLEAAGCNLPYPQTDVHLHQTG
ncbi:MAG: small conductance mechanosensitive channel [Lysobacterales bacterium]|jgi:small conductance mechanosensitive channel